MGNRSKYRRLSDLYTRGVEVVFDAKGDDDEPLVMWVQVLNPLERDDARVIASTARARLILALTEVGSDEQSRAIAEFRDLGRDAAIDLIAELKRPQWQRKVIEAIQAEDEWKEKLEILDRTDDILARPPEDAERVLMDKIVKDYMAETRKRGMDEENYEKERLSTQPDEAVEAAFLEIYRERRAQEVAFEEYRLTEAWMAARVCDGTEREDETWDHSGCDHKTRVYETKEDFKAEAEEIQAKVHDALLHLSMSEREAKNSDSATGSSDSSALQSPPEESTASTPIETLASAPGT